MPIATLKRIVLNSARAAGYEIRKLQPETEAPVIREPQAANAILTESASAVAPAEVVAPATLTTPSSDDEYLRYWTADQLAKRPFLNIGAGAWRMKHWRNVEFMTEHYGADLEIDINHDLMSDDPLPVESGSIELIYTSHTIEHLMTGDVEHLLAESFRVLRPGGVIRITCPEIEFYYRAYMTGDKAWFPYPETANAVPLESVLLTEFAGQLASHNTDAIGKKLDLDYVRKTLHSLPMAEALDALSAHIDRDLSRGQPSAHKSWWTAAKVAAVLERAGFKALRSGWGQSSVPVMRNRNMFDATVPWLSLFVEGVKGEPRRWD
jgi:hypothetical protein